ncbi:type IV toxin-antitoxin system AbiEi family antitoxin [Bacteroides fragilis]
MDLLVYVDKIGMNRTVTLLQELVQAMKVTALYRTAKRYPNTPVIQRLGYILDKTLSEEKLSNPLLKILNERNISPVLLIAQKEKQGELDETWKVIKNIEIESDL